MEVPKIPEKYRHEHIRNVNKNSTEELFTFLVRKVYFKGRGNEYLNHIQLSNLVFNETDSIFLKRITNEYQNYFDYKGKQKKKLNFEKIYQEHPHIWGEKKKSSKNNFKEDILDAIDDEIKETRRHQSKYYIDIHNISLITTQNEFNIYEASVVIKYDQPVSLVEGSKVKLIDKHRNHIWVTILEFNTQEEKIALKCLDRLENNPAKIQMSSTFLLYKQKEVIENLEKNNNPVWKLMNNHSFPNNLEFSGKIWDSNLDESQKKALSQSLKNDITYIWGPPGTGKTYTLSRILINLYNQNEKTVVCSIANVAVDGLLEKTIDLLKDYSTNTNKDILKERKILRIGYSQSDKVRNIEEIKFENSALNVLANEIEKLQVEIKEIEEDKNIEDSMKKEKKYQIQSNIDELKRKYDNECKRFILDSRLLFLTASKFIVEDTILHDDIDNLVIDEGSMMSVPSLLMLASKVRKRIIIAGDFRQLGPIALSNSKKAKDWLHKDLFSLLGNEKQIYSHSALQMLKYQRRSAKEIVDLINEPFYNNNLVTIDDPSHFVANKLPPSPGHISFINLPNDESNKASFSKNYSKYNKLSRQKAIELLKSIITQNIKIDEIGIITPYRQQLMDYKNELGELLDKENPKIKAGTIHTFQGSESDIIIWDIVDTPLQDRNQGIGRLYKGETGDRLVNVAISRAKSKLIIIGNNRTFHECNGRDSISFAIKKIVKKAWELSHKAT